MFPCYPMMFPYLPVDYAIPPTIKSLLDSYVNFNRPKDKQIKIADLPKAGRDLFFDFKYPLDDSLSKEEFEVLILKHFLMRRIGYETVNAFKIALEVKLNEIMPTYNKLYKVYKDWNIFEDGEITERRQSLETTGTANDTSTSDRRYSQLPQSDIGNVKDGSYLTDYNFDTNNSEARTTSNDNLNEYVKRSPADKMKNYQEFLQARQNILTMIFKDLDVLFYQVI